MDRSLRLTKSQSQLIAMGAIVMFFAVGILLFRSSARSRGAASMPEGVATRVVTEVISDQTAGTPSDFTLKQFYRSENADGRKLWEVRGERGEYFTDDATAKIKNAELRYFRKDGDEVLVTAQQALVYTLGASLSKAELIGQVVVLFGNDARIETERAIFDKERNMVLAPGPCTISNPSLEITGNSLEANLQEHRFILRENVRTVLNQRSSQ